MLCPNCGTANPDMARQCCRCGGDLPVRREPYCTVPGYVILTAFALFASVAVGVIYHFAARAGDIFILLAVAIGLGLGYAIAAGVNVARCRNLAFVAALAVVTASLAYGTRICLDGRYFVSHLLPQVMVKQLHMPPDSARRAARRIAASLGPIGSAHFYLDLRAETGATAQGEPDEDSVGIGAPLLWTFIAIQIAAIALVASRKGVRAASAPFCSQCGEWRGESVMFRMSSQRFEPVLQATANQAWEEISKLPFEKKVSRRDCCEIVTAACPECRSRTVTLRTMEGGRHRDIWCADLTEESSDRLYQARQVYLSRGAGVMPSA